VVVWLTGGGVRLACGGGVVNSYWWCG